MACVAMVKRDERNSKFCNSVQGEKRGASDSEGCRRRILIREPGSLDSTVRPNYSSDLEDNFSRLWGDSPNMNSTR